jgi:hypothetical protein
VLSADSRERIVNVGDWVFVDPGHHNLGGLTGRVLTLDGDKATVAVADADPVTVDHQFLVLDRRRKRRDINWRKLPQDR